MEFESYLFVVKCQWCGVHRRLEKEITGVTIQLVSVASRESTVREERTAALPRTHVLFKSEKKKNKKIYIFEAKIENPKSNIDRSKYSAQQHMKLSFSPTLLVLLSICDTVFRDGLLLFMFL